MKILLIGGTGYIGSRIFFDLKERHLVDSIDLEWFGNKINKQNIVIDFNDLSENDIEQYDVIILLAGHSSVGMCIDNMLPTLKNNVVNFCELLHKISNVSNKKSIKFVYAGSSSVYGSCHNKISQELDEYFSPHNFYDLSKQEIDYYAKISKNVEFYGLRFGTVNGWSPNLRDDIMLNAMFKSAIQTGEIKCFNKANYRPILDIADLSGAIQAIIEQGSFEKRGIYNLVSFNETIECIATNAAEIMQCKLIIDSNGAPTYSFSASNEKFVKAFNFKFTGTCNSILNSLKNVQGEYMFTNRNIKKQYG